MIHENEISEVFPQLLASPLPAVQGTKPLTVDWLLNHHLLDIDYATIGWFDNKNILYSVPSMDENQDRQFVMINIDTNENRIVGVGSDPVVSPDKQWIAKEAMLLLSAYHTFGL